MRHIHSFLLVNLILLGLWTRGQSAPPTTLDQVAPLTDDFTVAAARLDLTTLNLDAAFQTLTDLTSDGLQSRLSPVSAAMVASWKKAVKEWVSRFAEAGGREIYVLFNLNDLGMEPPLIVATPMNEGANVDALRELFVSSGLGKEGTCAVIKKCLVVAPKPILHRLEALQTAPAKNLRPAFAQAPPGALQAVFLPYQGAGRVLGEVMPVLPPILGGGSSAAVSHGFRWAILSVSSPPALSVQLAIQGQTGPDAEALRRTIVASLDNVGKIDPVRQALPQWETLAAMLRPSVEGDRLTLTWDRPEIERVVKTVLLPATDSARQKAQAIQSLNNLKQIGLAIILYGNDHQDQWPSHLAAILPYLSNPKPLLLPGEEAKCPADLMKWDYTKQVQWLDQHSAYTYLKPAAHIKDVKQPDKTLLAHQRLDTTHGATVPAVFADGHAERLNREAFEKLLNK
ncbi:MAG: hypothetical protein JXQ71_06675 [Verrucomicrobia bacterium]|nr:hypothetical protein [Verrucomicrobiota bacterium]